MPTINSSQNQRFGLWEIRRQSCVLPFLEVVSESWVNISCRNPSKSRNFGLMDLASSRQRLFGREHWNEFESSERRRDLRRAGISGKQIFCFSLNRIKIRLWSVSAKKRVQSSRALTNRGPIFYSWWNEEQEICSPLMPGLAHTLTLWFRFRYGWV